MILPGTTVTIKNPTSIYWGYVGFVQRISGTNVADLFDNYSRWEKMITFPIKIPIINFNISMIRKTEKFLYEPLKVE